MGTQPVDINSLLQRIQTPPSQAPQDPSGGNPNANRGNMNAAIDLVRPFAGNAVGGLAAAGTTLIPGLGESGIAEAGANNLGYALTDTLLQKLKTGDKTTLGEAFGEGEKNALVNSIGNKIIGALLRVPGALRSAEQPEIYNFLPKSSQALEAHGYHFLASGAKVLENLAPGANSEALDKAGGAGFTQALRFVNLLNGRQAGINANVGKLADQLKFALTDEIEPLESEYQPIKIKPGQEYQPQTPGKPFQPSTQPEVMPEGPIKTTKLTKYTVSQNVADTLKNGKNTFQVLDDALAPGNADKLSKILVAGQANGQVGLNVKQDLQAYHFMKMLQDGAKYDDTGNLVRFDPQKISKAWNDPNMQQSLDILYGKQGKQNATDFLQNIFKTSEPIKGTAAQGTAQYLKNRALYAATGGFVLGGNMLGALTGNISGTALGTIPAMTGLYIGANAIGRALTKPSTGRALVALAGGEPLSEGKQYLTKQLLNAFQGSSLAIIDAQGQKHPGTLEEDKQTGQLKWVND